MKTTALIITLALTSTVNAVTNGELLRIQLKKRSVPLSLLQKRGTSSIYPERISSLNSNTYLTYAGEVGSMNWEMRMGERDGGVGVSHHVYLRTEGRDLKNLTFHFPSYQLSIGTPPQAFSMLFDTGSFLLWAPGSSCTTVACQSLIQFKEKSSSTYVNLKTASDPITYADGSSVQGTLVKDTVAVGNLSVAGFELIDANSVSSAGGNIDGIVGMALVRAGGKGGDLFFERLAASGQLASSVFSYYVDESDENGEIIFGGVDTSRFTGDMIWVSVAQNSPYWAPLLGAFQVDGKVIAPSTSNLIAVLDTGTSLAYMSQDLATSVNAAIGATLYSNQGGQTQYSVSCNSIASLPIVTVSLGGHNFNLYPQQYFVAQDPYGQLCLTGFNGMQLDNIGFLIGNVLLRQWYIAFDFANERIGLATANRTAIGVSTGSLNPISGSIYNPGASSSNRDGSGSTAPAVVNPFDQIIHFFSSSPRTTPSPLPFRFVVASIITSFLTVFV